MIIQMFAFVLSALLSASKAPAQDLAGKSEMNGINYADYAGFEDKWKMFTVRYRTDTGEQRFVWGNEMAMQALKAGSTDYPDGAVFAKIGYETQEDPAFKNSRVPAAIKRYQFMVRDKKKYKETGGWGYALFDANKVTFNRDPRAEAMACYACHQLVPNRGEVFSQLINVSAFVGKSPELPMADDLELDVVKFKSLPLKSLPEFVQRLLPKTKTVRAVQGELRNHVFRGTIDELRPRLMAEARKSGLPSMIVAADNVQFAVVYPDKSIKKCPGKGLKSVFSTSVPGNAPDGSPYLVVAWQDICS